MDFQQPNRHKTHPLWLYLYFPDLFLHSLHVPENQPLAVLNPADHRVRQCTSAAIQAGVDIDMALPTALSLCPSLETLLLEPLQEQKLLQQRAVWAYQFSARIGLDTPHGLWLEVGTMLKLFGGLDALVEQIRWRNHAHWPLFVASSPIPLQARLLAQYQGSIEPAPLAFLSASQDQATTAIKALPLSHLLLPEPWQLALQRMGVKTGADLLRLPLSGLATRLGSDLVDWLRRLSGQQPQDMVWFELPTRFEQQALFVQEVEHLNGLIFPLRPLLSALAGFLQQRQLTLRTLNLTLVHRHQADTHWSFSFATFEHRFDELLALTRYRLERQTLPEPVLELRLLVDEFRPLQPSQTDSFPELRREQANHSRQSTPNSDSPFTPSSAARFERSDNDTLLNRLLARLEPEQLQRLKLTPDPRPEYASDTEDIALSLSASLISATDIQRAWPNAPLWLLPAPSRCHTPDATWLIPRMPMRKSTGWWDHRVIQRDYYRLDTGQQQLWVFRDAHNRWFLHGFYG
ncbi:MAG: hypothetical protein CMI09_04820 [Oceanospirillaceae bacterium]|nr:hypothetical protein [Oceanospirillaceae bacterium]